MEPKEIYSKITNYINTNNPILTLEKENIQTFLSSFSKDEIEALEQFGYIQNHDFECYAHVVSFLNETGFEQDMDDETYCSIFRESKHLSNDWFKKNPYIKNIHFKDTKLKEYYLTYNQYEKEEFLLYDFPDYHTFAPKLAYFDQKVSFPTLYEKNIPWMSVCPSEIFSMETSIKSAKGNVLVLGCGLGYYPYMISLKENVSSITIVEISKDILQLFKNEILPQFEQKEKIKVIHSDGIEFLKQVKEDEYDTCFVDIWKAIEDGLPLYKQILPFEKKLNGTSFQYWIQDGLEFYASKDSFSDILSL